ncbi:aminoglycoside phosphotransferase family protein [Candidatus Dojkabacteria bacterium]|nr:aminoglycoside phosphotransferase family protein [Candidatus Dojkabacteria bacterium]
MKEVKRFVREVYGDIPFTIKALSNALTTHAYRVTFEDRAVIVKVAYDSSDIEDKKGAKEKRILDLIKNVAPEIPTPEVDRYFEKYEGFPGYIIVLKVLPGKVLNPNEFMSLALTNENLNNLCNYIHSYHSYQVDRATDFSTFDEDSFRKYIEKYKQRFLKVIPKELKVEEYINRLDEVSAYFEKHPLHLIHRDVKFNNILFDKGRLSGIIDWEGAFTAPEAFEFAHISTLSNLYGYTEWIQKLIKTYAEKYNYPELEREIRIAELFCYLRWISRTFLHSAQKNGRCVETGEREIEYYVRKLNEWNEL